MEDIEKEACAKFMKEKLGDLYSKDKMATNNIVIMEVAYDFEPTNEKKTVLRIVKDLYEKPNVPESI